MFLKMALCMIASIFATTIASATTPSLQPDSNQELGDKISAFKDKVTGEKSDLETWVELSADVQTLQFKAENLVEQKLAIVLRNILLQELATWKHAHLSKEQKGSFEQILENLQWTPHLEKVLAVQSKEALKQLKVALGNDKKRQIEVLGSRVRIEPDPLGMWDRILKTFGLHTEISATPILEKALSKKSFQFDYFESYVNRYLAFAVKSFGESPYASLEKVLTPSLSEQIQKLKTDAGPTGWYFLESMVQFNFEEPQTMLAPMALQTKEQVQKLSQTMGDLEAPVEKAFALVVLYQVAKSWTEKDVQLLKTDLTLIEKLRLDSARQSYFSRFKKWPPDIDALLSKGELKTAPWDFINAQPLLMTEVVNLKSQSGQKKQ